MCCHVANQGPLTVSANGAGEATLTVVYGFGGFRSPLRGTTVAKSAHNIKVRFPAQALFAMLSPGRSVSTGPMAAARTCWSEPTRADPAAYFCRWLLRLL